MSLQVRIMIKKIIWRVNNMKSRKLISLSLALLLAAITLAGCSDATSPVAATAPAATAAATGATPSAAPASNVNLSGVTLRIAQTGWGSSEAALKAAGLDNTPYKVEYSVFQGGNLCLEAMAAGQIDFTSSSEIPPIFAAQATNGGNFKIIAVSNSNTLLQEVVIPAGSSLKSVADLKGKKVGYISATTAQYFLLKILQNAGLTWNDIQAVPITTADGVTALVGGQIDAFASYGNSITAAKKQGATTLASGQDILSGNFPYEASPAAIADPSKHAAILDYLVRQEKADRWQVQNIQPWANISAKPQGQTVDQAVDVLTKGFQQRPPHVKPVSAGTITSEQSVTDAFFTVGSLKAKLDVTGLYSDAFTNELNTALQSVQ